MSAEDSRKAATETKKAEITRQNAESIKRQVSDSDHLHNHLTQLIIKAANQGKFELEKQVFPADRFRDRVVDDVLDRLKADGYKVSLGKNNALHQIIFQISW